ncbi:hypothetical protein [Haloarcula sp. Atlit-120R]
MAIIDQTGQVEFLEFSQISVNLTHISLYEASSLADTVRVVLDDCS